MAAGGSVYWPSELELKLNLNAIKKSDQFVVNIIDTASQVALYKFKSETQAWDKTDVEGALFVYIRSSHPKHSFFIMNRLNMNNINEPVTCDMEFKQQDPFLLFKNKKNGIFGIWFYDAQECTRLSNLLIKLSSEETTPSRRPLSNPEFVSKDKEPKEEESEDKVDIMSMFAKAQEQYNKKTSEQVEPPEQKPPLQEKQQQKFLQQNQQQLEQLKSMLSGKEHVKVKQRAYSSPAPYQPQVYPAMPTQFPSITENGLSNNQLPMGYTREKDLAKPQSLSVSNVLTSQGTSDMSPDRPGAQRKLFQGDKQQVTKQQQDSPQKGSHQPVSVSTSLLSPMAFKTMAKTTTTTTTTPDPQPKSTPQKLDISPLTQEQLLQAMMYLMKNDSDFIRKLHEAYLKSLHELLPT
ncbi:mRNA-decapping enzyme 1B-like [Actinia tenebrosa]|uniref:mRNA-decapping enzyme 1B-like n=1 Tax=Actinia tenebrosa TaxID=6105 RepID=A0A6P8ID16_ACTTE|nr:mRNA-decapping enzyme 1B-like [Actinia tenebrosa]